MIYGMVDESRMGHGIAEWDEGMTSPRRESLLQRTRATRRTCTALHPDPPSLRTPHSARVFSSVLRRRTLQNPKNKKPTD